jgi:hypothetical protein
MEQSGVVRLRRSPGRVGAFRSNGTDDDHVDWLASGANFDRAGFDDLMNAIARGMMAS